MRPNARFDILVLNFQRVGLFLDNFHKLKGFDAARDRIVILDCSKDQQRERQLVEAFAERQGFPLGGQTLLFIERPNWGIDQGGRVDYIDYYLHEAAPYVWQFQEHYLDNTSDYSRWAPGSGHQVGVVKEDVIPDGFELDLDACEGAFADREVCAVFAARDGIGTFSHPDGREWFFADGANFGFRTAAAREAFTLDLLNDYRLVFDGSYRWCQFIEYEFSRRLSAGKWFDLVSGRSFASVAEVRATEAQLGRRVSTSATAKEVRVIDRYEQRMERVRKLPPALRKAMLASLFPAFAQLQGAFLPLRAKLLARGIDSPAWFRELW